MFVSLVGWLVLYSDYWLEDPRRNSNAVSTNKLPPSKVWKKQCPRWHARETRMQDSREGDAVARKIILPD